MIDSLCAQGAPDSDALLDAYTIHDGTNAGSLDGYEVWGPGGGNLIAKADGWWTALDAIRRDMDREQYWPDVFYVNDHGNIGLIDPTTGEEVASWV